MSKQTPVTTQVFCGELCKSNTCDSSTINLLHRDLDNITANITIGFDKFVRDPEALPPRIIDLLQVAAYVFCADRMRFRGPRDSINNNSWARSFEINIPVMDYKFWNDSNVSNNISEALQFMTGDREYVFHFYKAKKNILETKNKQLCLFKGEFEEIEDIDNIEIMLFSGGLDSLAGAIQQLNEGQEQKLCVVSHESSNKVMHTQSVIIDYLNNHYNNRIWQYGFKCHNHKMKSIEESQRTRMFLFSAIAFAICSCYGKHAFFVYENGITSINLPKQGDVMNARASRTTHPKTLSLLRKFYRSFDNTFEIVAPYYNKTKAEVMEIFKLYHEESIIPSSVSCSSTRKQRGQESHCGCCSQCIDRRLSIYAAGLSDYDALYTNNFITDDIPDSETKQKLYYTMRLASAEKIQSRDEMIINYPTEIFDVINYWPRNNPEDSLDEVYELLCKYGDSVLKAAKSMINRHEDLNLPVNNNSFLGIISDRKYLQSPFSIRISEIDSLLNSAIPTMFQRNKPKNEGDFNDKVEALLITQGSFTREYPVLKFWKTAYIPDHAQDSLLIESKYLRGNTTRSKITEGIAADITKMPPNCGAMFIVYDPERKILDDKHFTEEFESKRSDCFVRIYR